jgi:spermidine/putrescine transport system permease protein
VRRPGFLSVCGWGALLFLYVPVLVLAVFSFNGGRYTASWEGLSLRWYEQLLEGTDRTARSLAEPLKLSFRLALAASGAAVVLSALTAIGTRHAPRWLAWPLLALWSLPIVLPDIVLGVSWAGAFHLLGLEPGFPTLLLAHATICAAFGLVVVRARLATLDPTLLEAARDLGATRARATWHVVVPHLAPALVAAALLAFTISFDDFMVTFFLAPATAPTLPVRVYGTVTRGASPILNALATLSLLGTFVVAFVALRLVRTGAGARAGAGGGAR